MDFLGKIRQGVRTHGNVPCILQTLAPPVENLFGSLDRAIPGTPRHMIDSLNRQIIATLPGSQDVLLDVAGLAETVGLAEWHAPAEWNIAKLPSPALSAALRRPRRPRDRRGARQVAADA